MRKIPSFGIELIALHHSWESVSTSPEESLPEELYENVNIRIPIFTYQVETYPPNNPSGKKGVQNTKTEIILH